MDSTVDDDCPVCKGPFQNPSEPVPCCRKVFCQSCLRQAVLTRPQCPYCRSPINNSHASHSLRSALRGTVRLHGNGTSFRTTQTVGSNIHALLDQLRAVDAQASQTSRAPNIFLPNQVASIVATHNPVQPAVRPLRRPVPTPRVQHNIQEAPAALVTVVPIPVIIPVNTSPQFDLHSNGPDDINIFRTYNCPYCQEGDLDELDLRDHCNDNHRDDQRQVVCPVCVSLPHGNPTYCSRNFIGHLNLRHSYYIDDITNIYQNDDINLQDAILKSCQQR